MRAAHLCVVQPGGATQSLVYFELARVLRRSMLRANIEVSLGRNRLRDDRVNLVLGAHLAPDPDTWRRHACILLNTQRLDDASLAPGYLKLLNAMPVVDTEAANLPAYGARTHPLALWRPSAWVGAPEGGMPSLAKRPIELLLTGELTTHRVRTLQQLQSRGLRISRTEGAVEGPELTELVICARAVLLLKAHVGGGFDNVGAITALAQGTPVVAEACERTMADPFWAEAVEWFHLDADPAVDGGFNGAWHDDAAADRRLSAAAHHTVLESANELHAVRLLGAAVWAAFTPSPPADRLNLDIEHTGYRPGWLNVSNQARLVPDLLLDLSALPAPATTPAALHQHFEIIDAGRQDPASPGAQHTLRRALDLLRTGGVVVCEAAVPAGIDDAIRWGSQAWSGHCEQFWHSGAFRQRLQRFAQLGMDAGGAPAEGAAVRRIRWVLKKVDCTLAERTRARKASEDFAADL